jgi:hypothetical protein
MMIGSLHIQPLRDGSMCLLAHDYGVEWRGESIVVPKGFDSDYASVPRLLWRAIPPHYYPHASILHDWLYTVRLYDRATCDRIYYEAMRSLQQSDSERRKSGRFGSIRNVWMDVYGWLYARTCWLGVRLFGGRAYRATSASDCNLYRAAGMLPPA